MSKQVLFHRVEATGRTLASHPEHDAMLDVEQNLLLLPVVSDEGVQGVAVGHPSDQTRVCGQRDHGVALNAGEGSTNGFGISPRVHSVHPVPELC